MALVLIASKPVRARKAVAICASEPTTPASVAEPLAWLVKATEARAVEELSSDALSVAGSVPAAPPPAPPPQAASTTEAIRERLMESGSGKAEFCDMFNPQEMRICKCQPRGSAALQVGMRLNRQGRCDAKGVGVAETLFAGATRI